jgi:rubrerythrin
VQDRARTAHFRTTNTAEKEDSMKKQAQEILKQCLLHEKEGLDFYREAATRVVRERARKALETLIAEEQGHIESLFSRYSGEEIGDVHSFLASPPHIESSLIRALEKGLDPELASRKVMELAMRLEEENRDSYRSLAAACNDPEIKAVYEKLARDEDRHYQIVESEYARLMAMVHETDIDTYVRE